MFGGCLEPPPYKTAQCSFKLINVLRMSLEMIWLCVIFPNSWMDLVSAESGGSGLGVLSSALWLGVQKGLWGEWDITHSGDSSDGWRQRLSAHTEAVRFFKATRILWRFNDTVWCWSLKLHVEACFVNCNIETEKHPQRN